MSTRRCWLLNEKSDGRRISKGIEAYLDRTGECYNFDSLVPNHTKISSDDVVVLRLDDEIVGIGRIGSVSKHLDQKRHRRCPVCRSTDIRGRVKRSPPFKCGKCAFEFTEPTLTSATVTAYQAVISDFNRLANAPGVLEVKACALSGDGISSQLSILELDLAKLQTLMEGIQIRESPHKPQSGGQGIGLTAPERKAVETRAMWLARQVYESEGWQVVDTSASKPYDLMALNGDSVRFIEVKGTTGLGQSILLTQREVEHARAHPEQHCLFVISGIVLEKVAGQWAATGGVISARLEPWLVDLQFLQPTQYRYAMQSSVQR